MILEPAPTASATVLSPPWLEQALAPSLGAVTITAVRMVEMIKVSAAKIRFEVDIQGRDAPLALCVKGFFDEPLRDVVKEISQVEARFYGELAAGTGLVLPRCYHAGVDPTVGHGVVLMEDVIARGGRFLTVLEPYSVARVEKSLEQLARLHAARWGQGDDPALAWLEPAVDWMIDRPLISPADLTVLMNGERGDPLPPALRSGERLVAGLAAIQQRLREQPACLVHGDAHAGNAFELNGEQGFVDWQLLHWGSWSLDVAYHVGVALSVEDRRTHEKGLVAHYLKRLGACGVDAPAFDGAFEDYRRQLAYGFYLWAITRRVQKDITHEMVRRLGLAVADHASLDRLGV